MKYTINEEEKIKKIHDITNKIKEKYNEDIGDDDLLFELLKKESDYEDRIRLLNNIKTALEKREKTLEKLENKKESFEKDFKESEEDRKKLSPSEIKALTNMWENLFIIIEKTLNEIIKIQNENKINYEKLNNFEKAYLPIQDISINELHYLALQSILVLSLAKLLEPREINKRVLSESSIFYYFPQFMNNDNFKMLKANYFIFDYYGYIAPMRDKIIAHYDLNSIMLIKTQKKCPIKTALFLFEWDILKPAITSLRKIATSKQIKKLNESRDELIKLKDSN